MKRRTKLFIIIPLALLLVYTLAGFFLVPWIVTRFVLPKMSEQLNGEIRVEKLEMNPFSLSARVHELRVLAANGDEIAGVSEGFANLTVASLWRSGIRFQELRAVEPRLKILVAEDNTVNVVELVRPFTERAKEEAEAGEEEDNIPVLGIQDFQVSGARFTFIDQRLEEDFEFEVRDIAFSVTDFLTDPANRMPYRLDALAEDGMRVTWEGHFSLFPIRSYATVSVTGFDMGIFEPYYRDLVNFDIDSGLFSVQLRYEFAPLAEPPVFSVHDLGVSIDNFVLVSRQHGSPFFSLPSLKLTNLELIVPESRATLEKLTVDLDLLRVERDPDGTLSFLEWLPPGAVPEGVPAEAEPEERLILPEASLQAAWEQIRRTLDELWSVRVDEIVFEQDAFDFVDFAIRQGDPVVLRLSSLRVTASNVANFGERPITVGVESTILNGGSAKLSLETNSNFDTFTFEFEVADVPAASLEPYADAFAALSPSAGLASASGSGSMAFSVDADVPDGDLNMRAAVKGLQLADASDNDVLGFESLDVPSIRARTNPLRIEVGEVRLIRPEANVVRFADGSLNLFARAAGDPDAEIEPVGETEPDASTPATEPAGDAASQRIEQILDLFEQLEVAGVFVEEGRVHFIDTSLDPQLDLDLADMLLTTGRVDFISAEPTDFTFDARARSGGTIRARGQFKPDPVDLFADAKVEVDTLALVPFSTYGENFVGYAIESGSLTLNSSVTLQGLELDTVNDVRLDAFDLADESSGKASIGVPVHLGISLLKDRDDVIELDSVEIYGDFASPETRLPPLIMQAFVRVIGNIATKPFAFIGSAFGGSAEDLETLFFEVGSSRIRETERDQLIVLADALFERPQLNLTLEPGYAETDRDALREEKLQAQLQAVSLEASRPERRTISEMFGDRELNESEQRVALKFLRELGKPAAATSGSAIPSTTPTSESMTAAQPAPASSETSSDERTVRRRAPGGGTMTVRTPADTTATVSSSQIDQLFASMPEPSAASSPSTGAASASEAEAASGTSAGPVTVSSMRDQLLARIEVSPEELETLARQRADTARSQLLEDTRISEERIQIVDEISQLDEPAVKFGLR